VRAVAAACGGTVEGLALGSQDISFFPGELRGGSFEFDVGTAGSVPLVLQALLPSMVASGHRFEARLIGGTDVRAAPPLDYLEHVLIPLLARLGVRASVRCLRRGYYPRGGGIVDVRVEPHALGGCAFESPGRMLAMHGVAHAAGLPAHVPERMRASAVAQLPACGDIGIEARIDGEASGAGGAIVIWAQTEHTILGAGRVARRGVPAETLGGEAGSELAADLRAGATLDVHAADQILVYLALGGGGSFLTRSLSLHARTAMWLIGQMLPMRFSVSARGALEHVAVSRAPP
jgi:RNA 3'-terminal phosphate cyclase (ATP)